MSAVRDPSAARANNVYIESSFNLKKRDAKENKLTLGAFGKIKVARYTSFMSETVDVQAKAILLGLPTKAGNKRTCRKGRQEPGNETEADVYNSKEMYKKRDEKDRFSAVKDSAVEL